MEVGVRVTAEDVRTKSLRHTVTAYLTFVALDENHKPTLVPSLLLKTEEEKKRFAQAEERRKWRLKRRQQLI